MVYYKGPTHNSSKNPEKKREKHDVKLQYCRSQEDSVKTKTVSQYIAQTAKINVRTSMKLVNFQLHFHLDQPCMYVVS